MIDILLIIMKWRGKDMFGFVSLMWVMRRITEQQVLAYVAKGYITQQEADMILVTPQV
jgi:hypothetical protein